MLVNNAAIDPKFDRAAVSERRVRFEDFPLQAWNEALSVNVTGMFLCAQAVATPMLAQGGGVIINVSSMYGMVGPDHRLYEEPGAAAAFKPVTYSVTKSAVFGLTRYLATYWAGKNIRVNTLTLGGVENEQSRAFVQRYAERTPMGRMARPDEYCGALLFLASDASSYMTGATGSSTVVGPHGSRKQNRRSAGDVTARGGSKGITRKNVREIGGHPLIATPLRPGLRLNGGSLMCRR